MCLCLQSSWDYRHVPPPLVNFLLFYFLFFEAEFRSCYPCWIQQRDLRSRQPPPSGFRQFFCLSLMSSWDYRHTPLCPADFFVFLVETGFHHVDQDGLDLRSGIQDQSGQYDETPSLLKIYNKINQVWWHAPVISAIQEADAGESLELRWWRLQ